jgi:hypothetical protein
VLASRAQGVNSSSTLTENDFAAVQDGDELVSRSFVLVDLAEFALCKVEVVLAGCEDLSLFVGRRGCGRPCCLSCSRLVRRWKVQMFFAQPGEEADSLSEDCISL